MANVFYTAKTKIVDPSRALPGRPGRAFELPDAHFVLGTPLEAPFPSDTEQLVVAMGCFWGAERAFWTLPGVHTTAVGYTGGFTPNPTYEEVCSGRTGHTEAVLVVFRPSELAVEAVLGRFWESHDPTQGMRQGNDVGTQYRSGIYTTAPAQASQVADSARDYQQRLSAAGMGAITTEVAELGDFWYAEGYHQQYLAKNPGGYCGLGGTGVSCPTAPR